MKILKPGKTPAEDVFRGKCSVCGCEIECVRSEIREFNCGTEYFDGVECPTEGCRHRIEVHRHNPKQKH